MFNAQALILVSPEVQKETACRREHQAFNMPSLDRFLVSTVEGNLEN